MDEKEGALADGAARRAAILMLPQIRPRHTSAQSARPVAARIGVTRRRTLKRRVSDGPRAGCDVRIYT